MSDGSKVQLSTTAGLEMGDKYSYLCLVDQHSGEVIEEGRLRTAPQAFKRRFASERPPMRNASASRSRPEPTRHGPAGYSRGAATRSWWPTHAS
jgi:hypothetical protein